MDTRYPCDQCERTFAHGTNLRRHKRTSHGKGGFACDVCGKTFPRRDNMLRHRRDHEVAHQPADIAVSSAEPMNVSY